MMKVIFNAQWMKHIFQANVQYKDKEDELSALGRRIMLLETESNGADVKLAKTTMEVASTKRNNFSSVKRETPISLLFAFRGDFKIACRPNF